CQDAPVIEDTAYQRRRMDLIKVQVIAEQRPALLDLALQGRQGVVFDLVHPGVDLPVADVGIAPLRADRDTLRWERALAEPRRQEPLREAIGARGINVANPGVIGSAQDLVRSALQRLDASVVSEIMRAVDREIPGATQRRQAKPDRRDPQPGRAQRPKCQARGRGSGYGCLRIRAFSSWNSASESTPDCFNSPICRNCS